MTRLDIRLLGEFAVLYGGTPLTSINSQRLQCLLAYLLLHRDAPVARQRLAFLFWPDSTEPQARSNLRNLLHALTQALPNDGEHFVETDGQTVQWRAGASYTLDVDTLLASLDVAQTAQELQRALDIYRGPLLPSCYDDWIVPERERLEQRVADVVQRFIDRFEAEGAYHEAIVFAQRIVRRDPLREDLYRQIMRLYALSGDRAGIARTYKECREVLKRELDVEPSRQTVATYEKCKQLEPPAIPAAATPASLPASVLIPLWTDTPVAPGNHHAPELFAASAALTPERVTQPKVGPAQVTDVAVRRAVLADALQHPATEIPLALSYMSALALLLYLPTLPALPAAVASAAWVLFAVSAVAGAGSFIWHYGVKFDKAYETKARTMQAEWQGASHQDEQAKLGQRRAVLQTGFRETRVAEGHYVLRDLDFEYEQLSALIARHKETDPLALSYLPALVDETYRQGLSVLEDALELARAISAPKDQRLDAEIKELGDKVAAAAGKADEAGRVRLWQETAAGLRHRQELICKERLRLDELLQHAARCETALNQTRVELAALKADSWTVSVNAVLETLQKTIDQAKAVQDEMRKLGY
jgi:DNA-binding SARP family transcriptional activator